MLFHKGAIAMGHVDTRLVVAINPSASFGKNASVGEQVVAELRRAGCEVVAVQEENLLALKRALEEILASAPRALVVVGGDGMVHLGVDLCVRWGIPLGVIPSGTGNDLARHLGIPLDLDDAQRALIHALEGEPLVIDHGLAQGGDGVPHPFACVLSAGFDAIVNERANRLRFPKGRHRYTLALLIELIKLRPLSYTLEIDGVKETGRYLLVAVANSRSFGGGMKVTPQASLQDGLLDVFTLKPLSRLAFLRIYPRVFAGTHVSDPRVSIRQARNVKIECDGVIAYADGEAVGPLPLDVSVTPGALKVYAPVLAQDQD
jgi:diacylglycerol kinase (ATP)